VTDQCREEGCARKNIESSLMGMSAIVAGLVEFEEYNAASSLTGLPRGIYHLKYSRMSA
jgi:hypothetical protein